MPRNPPSDVEHVVFTDHSIRRRAGAPNVPPPSNAELVPYWGGKPSARDLGLAYAMVGLREQNAEYLERAFRLLQGAVAKNGADAQAIAYLAQFYRDRKDDAHALPLYERAWQMDRTQAPVTAALGAYAMQRGHVDEAIRFWKQALDISPALLLVRTNLAAALVRAGQAGRARDVLRRALDFNPAFQPAKDLLKKIAP